MPNSNDRVLTYTTLINVGGTLKFPYTGSGQCMTSAAIHNALLDPLQLTIQNFLGGSVAYTSNQLVRYGDIGTTSTTTTTTTTTLTPATSLGVNDPAYSDSIGYVGEHKWYTFTTSTSVTYTMQTYGFTHLYMKLWDSTRTTLIAQDVTAITNPYISLTLSASTVYYLEVYYQGDVGTGAYLIRVMDPSGTTTTTTTTTTVAPTAPTVSTQAVTNISYTTATGNGTLISDGNSSITHIGICWSTSHTPTTADSTAEFVGSFSTTYSVNMISLSPFTTYYVRAYATNGVGTSYGSAVSFSTVGTTTTSTTSTSTTSTSTTSTSTTTTAPPTPTVTTQAVTGIGQLTATGNGTVTVLGDAVLTGFCWNTTGTPTAFGGDPYTFKTPALGAFTDAIGGAFSNGSNPDLIPSTFYYVRSCIVDGSYNVHYGGQVTFTSAAGTTTTAAPTTTTAAPTTTTAAPLGTQLIINATPTSGNIVLSSQDDWYYFDVAGDNALEMRTNGSTDMYMQLYEVDMTTLLAWDDDDGGSLQPLIISPYTSGNNTYTLSTYTRYYLKVYTFNHASVGTYTVQVSTVV